MELLFRQNTKPTIKLTYTGNLLVSKLAVWVPLTEFHPRHNNEQINLLVFALDGHTCKTTIKLKIAADRKLTKSL